LSRETLKDFLNSRGSSADSISVTLSEKPDGLGVEPNTGEELLNLANDAKGLLGDYVKHLIDMTDNEYKLKGGNSLAGSGLRGEDLTIADSQGAEKIFIEQGTILKSKLNENSNSKQFNSSGTDLDTLIDKVGKNFSNHEKLKEVQGQTSNIHGKTLVNPNGEDNDIVQATQRVFLQNNRFANVGDQNRQSFTDKPQSVSEFESAEKTTNVGTYNLQNKFGSYDKDSKIVSIDQLKQLGASLLLKSSGFSGGNTPGTTGNTQELLEDISNGTAFNFNRVAGFSKLDTENMRAKNSKGFPEDIFGSSFRSGKGNIVENDPNANNIKSFGSTYNSAFRFQGNTLKLHNIQAAISMIALKNVGLSFWSDFIERLRTEDKIDLNSSGEAYVKENANADVLTYMLGKSRQLSSLQLDSHIFSNLLTNTTYSYSAAVDRGFDVIFRTTKDERDNKEKVAQSKVITDSPGFWIAVSRSILKTLDNVYSSQLVLNQNLASRELFVLYKSIVDSNKFIQFFNVLATIGDISLASTAGVKTKLDDANFKHPRDVDAIPDNRAIPGKSRNKDGLNRNELSWSQDAPTSMYLLPANIIRAAGKLNNTVFGESPVRAMFGSKLAKSTYTGVDVDGSYNRIPKEVVKIVEDKLDAEYMPFYIQDLRTNEIISFQAFLSSLTDSITPNYTSVKGYGRADAVQIYESTSRSLNVDFTLFATNREDFDTMWYKINKFITLLYPQYTPGTMVSNGAGSKFYQPFSQVVGASPIVRLRIGDVIKSNYSRFGLARTFGIGDTNVSAVADNRNGIVDLMANGASNLAKLKSLKDSLTDIALKVWLTTFGSPHSVVNAAFGAVATPKNAYVKIAKSTAKSATISALSNLLVNGFANPLAVDSIMAQLKDPNSDRDDVVTSIAAAITKIDKKGRLSNSGQGLKNGYTGFAFPGRDEKLRQMILKPNVVNGYFCAENGKKYLTSRRLKVLITEKGAMSNLSELAGLPSFIGYKVKIIDSNAPSEISAGSDKHFIVRHSDILPDPKELFTNSLLGTTLFALNPGASVADSFLELANEYTLSKGIPNELNDLARMLYLSDEAMFMRPEVNPFTRAIETTKGRGLAGVIKGITFNWIDDFPWEVDHNARAPMGVKISFAFDVIHDLPPGLDHSGYNRAPLYNVGEVMKNISGDVYSDDGRTAEFNFRKEGAKATRVKGENNS